MTVSLKVEFDVPAEMRDGTILRANIFRPDDESEYPIALTRTPYGKDYMTGFPFMDLVRLAQAGFIVIAQDVRGRGKSDGEWELFTHEAEDGYDTVEWAAALHGSNGNVGMWGFSYLGFTQWTAATLQPPHLKAIMPAFTWSDTRNGMFWRGGALELGLLVHLMLPSLGLETIFKRHAQNPEELGKAITTFIHENDHLKDSGFLSLPLDTLKPIVNTQLGVEYLADLIANPNDEKFSAMPYSITQEYKKMQIPAFNIAGWNDIFSQDTIRNYTEQLKAADPDNPPASKLIIGPWAHLNYSNVIGEADYGMTGSMTFIDGQYDHVALTARWFDYWLKGKENGILDEPPIKVFLSGKNTWVHENEWPPTRTIFTPLYLHKGASLSIQMPKDDEPSIGYSYDSANPTPTWGGAVLMHPVFVPGVKDQRGIEHRNDILSFTSQPLTEDLQVMGPVEVKLWASSSAPETDFVARLIDVHPDGYAHNLTDGIIRTPPQYPGKVMELNIDLWSVGHVFETGHSLRLDIASANFPRWDRNPNTGKPFGQSADLQIAEQTIYIEAQYPSHIILPVIPK
ncbi:MAG: CocE/NonD family hydrolase [Anaerolineaceae bacterium]|nr:CocE/NonD family hydrolase [Anaerolineaceae bacterium]